jgi:hypothetical protein
MEKSLQQEKFFVTKSLGLVRDQLWSHDAKYEHNMSWRSPLRERGSCFVQVMVFLDSWNQLHLKETLQKRF